MPTPNPRDIEYRYQTPLRLMPPGSTDVRNPPAESAFVHRWERLCKNLRPLIVKRQCELVKTRTKATGLSIEPPLTDSSILVRSLVLDAQNPQHVMQASPAFVGIFYLNSSRRTTTSLQATPSPSLGGQALPRGPSSFYPASPVAIGIVTLLYPHIICVTTYVILMRSFDIHV
ncbi:hypothetical protein BDR06DRAFT_997572 [Suillus hirtellus]|nr:hypothetical protein BDR06DRAFT_997572 [Suillus hirtellus]